jgi:hypothetical protein
LNDITSIRNFMKICEVIQKWLVWESQTDGDRQTDWWFDKPTFILWK